MSTTLTIPSQPLPAIDPNERIYRLSIPQYLRMGEVGILKPQDQVELIEGLLVKQQSGYPLFDHETGVINQSALWRISVADYQRMGEDGILTPEDRVELIDGQLMVKPMQNWIHIWCVQVLIELIIDTLPHGLWHQISQSAIQCDESSPEPDITIIRGTRQQYRGRLVSAADIALVIEVANTSLDYDSTVKRQLYARNGIPQYWVVNTIESVIDVYTYANEFGDYQHLCTYTRSQQIPLVLDGQEIATFAVADIIPEAQPGGQT